MSNWATNKRVEFDSFTRQIDGSEVVIGRSDRAEFLVLPTEALELLDYLFQGKTIGEAQSLYQQKYGEIPDIVSLLDYLDRKGFICDSEADISIASESANKRNKRYHFANFPERLAQRLFSRNSILVCGLLIGLALVAAIAEPSIIPGWESQFFKTNLTLMSLIFLSLQFIATFLHEMAHLVAARAVGVSCRLGIGNRMWVLVAETDMTGVWAIPKQLRYLPYLAGPLLDAVSASILVLVFFTAHYQWIGLHPLVWQMGQAMLLFYLTGMLWQCFFFVRTDFYYVFTNVFGCKNLLKDTEVFVKNQVARIVPWVRSASQAHIPRREMQVIRYYALLWFLGRSVSMTVLVFISLPLVWNYLLILLKNLGAGYGANPYGFVDSLLAVTLLVIPQVAGFWLWHRNSLFPQK